MEIIPEIEKPSNSHTYESRYETDIDLTLEQNQLTKRVIFSKIKDSLLKILFSTQRTSLDFHE